MANTSSRSKKCRDLFEDLEFFGQDDLAPLALGGPGPSTIAGCKDVMLKATQQTLSDPEQEKFIFQYGPRKGDPGFLEELAAFLTSVYGDHVSSDHLMVTAGATQGLHLVASVMFQKSHIPVFVEDPTYFIAIKILRDDYGYDIEPVPVDDDGVNLDELEAMFKKFRALAGPKSSWPGPFWTMFYTMSVYSNPLSRTLPPAKCERLIQLARKYDVLILSEDVYNMIHYGEDKPPQRLFAYDHCEDSDFEGGHVLSNCTFSKIFAPGMRLGWLEGYEQVLNKIATCNTAWSGGSFNHYTSRLMATALSTGLIADHLKHINHIYGKRMTVMCEELPKHLPVSEGRHFKKPQGGFFVWVQLQENVDTTKLLKLASEKYGVNFIAGKSTSPTGGYKNYLRLSVSYADEDKIKTGLSRLGKALVEYTSTEAS